MSSNDGSRTRVAIETLPIADFRQSTMLNERIRDVGEGGFDSLTALHFNCARKIEVWQIL